MTLLTALIAGIISTIVWYTSEKARKLNVSMLCFMFWGASLMWLVDAVAEYMELGAEYFVPAPEDMLNDAFLGVCVITLAMIIWIVNLLIKDPDNLIHKRLKNEK